ncbi:glycosyltransferase family A protein [Agrobacterium tumefaciens]|uniref:Glycosyl transferase n=1 Tax=Agrobacterium tumefaciens TaxID=358 RepID=A0A176XHE9_AGRTU|nr:glycosyltransferase family A protein [Agrobacterium tumefaciens]OAE48274.1 glycosyl transferase [Agrobacterium tumefaciens]
MSSKHDELVRQIGHGLLGPVVQRWLLGLHQYVSYYDDGDTVFLHCARAGVRIQKLYQLFLEGFPGAEPPNEVFWVSRLSACKGTYQRARERSSAIISKEYAHSPISDLIRGILRHHPGTLARIDLGREEYKAHGSVFPGWIQGPTPAAVEMRKYLEQCGIDFDAYIKGLVGGRSRAVLIDSGWQGSMQSLLTNAFPEIKWRGLYFGRSLLPGHDRSIVNQVLGILFESETYDPSVPETAFVRHRHIVETLLEPNGPSIEEVPGGAFDHIARTLISANENEIVDDSSDALYLAVVDYLSGEGRSASISEIISRHQRAMAELARIIVTPTRAEAVALICKDRSADFGKSSKVPVLAPKGIDDSADLRIQRALWQEGQVALEFDGGFARDMQLRIAGRSDAAAYFEPSAGGWERQKDQSVAIITRTKNRPLLLRRAAESVARQTYSNYVWVVVNDGGDESVVRDVIDNCYIDRRKIILVSNARSLGMEAASNAGIKNSDSDLIVIHDDDDSWEPTFLEKTTAFLAAKAGGRYGGVITHTTYVSEEIRDNAVIEHARHPYMDWVRNVQLVEMAAGNIFAPIAFLFRREIWNDIGGYNEFLPVLGDWFFNLEFLLRTDIGVLTDPLANYHHRDRGDTSAYANSVIGGISKHEEYASIARNEFIRKYAEKSSGAVAAVVSYFAGDIRRDRAAERHAEKQNALRVVKDHDSADKYWTVAHLNRIIGTRRGLLSHKRSSFIDPGIEWSDLEELLRKMRAAVPIPPSFDEEAYLRRNEDVATAVKSGKFRSGYEHYIIHGRGEGRTRSSI